MASGEYIQMSGRAGRRGKDDRGLVIVMADEQLDEAVYRSMVKGKPSPIVSSFKLTYYTLLNLIKRAEGAHQNMEYVIKNSFQQFQQERSLPQVRASARAAQPTCIAIRFIGKHKRNCMRALYLNDTS